MPVSIGGFPTATLPDTDDPAVAPREPSGSSAHDAGMAYSQLGGRDILVIGASAGGVQAVSELAAGLPRDLPASVFVVVHTLPHLPSMLPDVLTRRGPLRAAHPLHGE
jgi:chemotaxis response regulator CheB